MTYFCTTSSIEKLGNGRAILDVAAFSTTAKVTLIEKLFYILVFLQWRKKEDFWRKNMHFCIAAVEKPPSAVDHKSKAISNSLQKLGCIPKELAHSESLVESKVKGLSI